MSEVTEPRISKKLGFFIHEKELTSIRNSINQRIRVKVLAG